MLKMRKIIFILLTCSLCTLNSYAQSGLETILKGGEIIVNGLSFLKNDKVAKGSDTKVIESLCIKNKLAEKITFKITGKDTEGNELTKELVIPNDGKECVYELPKGIYAYEITLPNKEIFKKGEYKFSDELVITVK